MTISENQVRHLYVAKGSELKSLDNYAPYTAGSTAIASALTSVGDIAMCKNSDDELYFQYKSATGEIVRTDLIPLKNIKYVKATAASLMETPKKIVKVTPTTVVAGENYMVRIVIHNYIGMSDEDTYIKYAQAKATSTSASALVSALKTSLEKNLSKELTTLFTVSTAQTTTSGDTLVITEAEQPWKLGTMQRTPVLFDVQLVSDDDSEWGTVTVTKTAAGAGLTNTKNIADLEYFLMGERGDLYRNAGWPNVVPTKYLVTEAAEGYDVLDIHYSYVGNNEGCQASEKTLTFVGAHIAADASTNTASAVNAVLDDIKDALEDLDITVQATSAWA